ncbi:carboxypeptidase-like regulatory domain-containing protein [uncultured Gimesia sp.]|uniref:carboxypeptidase-like regulatory domain-containing protein n=1 Tax=uncultured Gimesia sp. TaxID=1678688 RepID=UPI0030D7F6C1|tara:strand:- start:68975 stop:69418 length:444 start_codon:yes stop_codon:yes gene_type:complete
MHYALKQYQFYLFSLILALGSVVSPGCSHTPGAEKPRSDIQLTILSGGAPVTEGMVNLENPETGEGGGGVLTADGKVTIPNVVLGTYTVTIVPPDPDPVPPEPGQPATAPKTFKNIPKKFRENNASPLKVEVKADSNEFTFDLKDAG